jgi:hypothetical protein
LIGLQSALQLDQWYCQHLQARLKMHAKVS